MFSSLRYTRLSVVFVLTFVNIVIIKPLPPENAPQIGNFQTFLPAILTPEPQNGVAWAWYGNRQPGDAELLNVEWFHIWSTRPIANAPIGFVQHIWCDRYPAMDWLNGTNLLQKAQSDIPADYDSYILFYNEPDYKGQCERTPRQAAFAYKQIREMFPSAILIGPMVSDQDYRKDWVWTKQFYNELMGLQVPLPDIGSIHTYMGEHPQLIIDSFFDLMATYPNAPTTAWVTEFGARRPEMVQLMLETYQNDPRILRWGYFTPRILEDSSLKDLALLDENGLTAVGQAYVEMQK